MAKDERLLQIHGKSDDTFDTVVRAVKLNAKRKVKQKENVAFKIDLVGLNSMKQIMKTIYRKLENYVD